MPLTSFHPVDDGFKFSNSSFVNPIINIPLLHINVETKGRCGGMAYAALDYWYNKLPIPETSQLPADGTVLADMIYARLADSLFANAIRNLDFMNMLDHPTFLRGKGAARVTREDEFPKIRASIDAGHPCAVGLFNARNVGELGNDHQVVCYGYEFEPDTSRLFIYDNNYPDSESTLSFTTNYVPSDRPLHHSDGNSWRGFFAEAYTPQRPWYLNEGTLLRESDQPAVRAAKGGATCWIESPQEFESLGFLWQDIHQVGQGSFAELEQYAGDGMLVQERDRPEIYVVFGGKAFHIPGPSVLEAMGFQWQDVITIPQGAVSRMRSMSRDRTLLREMSSALVCVVQSGQIRPFPSGEIFEARGYHWDNVRMVPDGAFGLFPLGPPIS